MLCFSIKLLYPRNKKKQENQELNVFLQEILPFNSTFLLYTKILSIKVLYIKILSNISTLLLYIRILSINDIYIKIFSIKSTLLLYIKILSINVLYIKIFSFKSTLLLYIKLYFIWEKNNFFFVILLQYKPILKIQMKCSKKYLHFIRVIDWLIEFNGMANRLGLFYDKRLKDSVSCSYLRFFVFVSQVFFFRVRVSSWYSG